MRRYILNVAFAASVISAGAVAPYPGPVTYVQPDGSRLEVVIEGNEFGQIYRHADTGVELLSDEEGRLQPATAVQLRGVRQMIMEHAGVQGAPTSRGEGLHKGYVAHTGSPDVCVVLVQFSDVKFALADPKTYFSNWLNQENYTTDGNSGSVRDYFKAQSSGRFTPNFEVYGPVTLGSKRSSYASTSNAYKMVHEACGALDSQVDFSKYDADGDGRVDNVYVIFAGQGSNYGGSNAPWPHNSECPTGLFTKKSVDGKLLYHYACACEQGYTAGQPDGIGTFIHEFGHTLGFPDFYNTVQNGNDTPYFWSIMDRGNYLNYCKSPIGYSAYERHAMDWLDYTELADPAKVNLRPLAEYNYAVTIPTGRTGDFYILENRPATGWDRGIYGGGMLVWHIDASDESALTSNPNNDSSHLRVRLVRADNNDSSDSFWGDAWPGSSNNTAFTSTSVPAMVRWNSSTGTGTTAIDRPVTNITKTGDLITFDYRGGSSTNIVDPEAKPVTPDTRSDYAHIDDLSAYAGSTRGVKTLTITDDRSNTLTVAGPGNANGHPIYVDRTSQTLTVNPGARLTVTGTADNTEWMHSYVYIDFGRDGRFDVDADNAGVHKDLVAHTGYRTSKHASKNDTADPTQKSDGTAVNNGNFFEIPIIVLPANMAEGTYRLRYKNDWNSNDPYGRCQYTLTGYQTENFITTNGGSMIDVMLKVEPLSAIDGISEDGDKPAEYFNLTGIPVPAEHLTPGIYIIRRGKNVKKAYVVP